MQKGGDRGSLSPLAARKQKRLKEEEERKKLEQRNAGLGDDVITQGGARF